MSAYRSANATAPAHGALAVTPSDTTVLETTRGLFIGSTGDVAVVMADGQTVTFTGVPTGSLLPIQVTKVKAATSASAILALY